MQLDHDEGMQGEDTGPVDQIRGRYKRKNRYLEEPAEENDIAITRQRNLFLLVILLIVQDEFLIELIRVQIDLVEEEDRRHHHECDHRDYQVEHLEKLPEKQPPVHERVLSAALEASNLQITVFELLYFLLLNVDHGVGVGAD